MNNLLAFSLASMVAFSAGAGHAAAPESLPVPMKFTVTLKTDSVVVVGGVQKTFKAGESFTVFAGENIEVVSGEANLDGGKTSAVITAGNSVEVQLYRGTQITGIKVIKGMATVTSITPDGKVFTNVRTEKDSTIFAGMGNYFGTKVVDVAAQGQTFVQSPIQEVVTVVSPSSP